MGKLDDLEKLQKLKESGVLTDEEFNVEKQKILKTNYSYDNNMDTVIQDNYNKKYMIEIKGNFPFEESKIPLTLLEGERVIIQHKGVMCSGAINDGYITLTNKRILFNKSTGKNFMRAGLTGIILGANRKNEEIEFSQIVAIESAKYIQGSAGIKIVTNDGYTHKYVLQSMNIASKEPINRRNQIIKLIKSVVKIDDNIEQKAENKINESQRITSRQIEKQETTKVNNEACSKCGNKPLKEDKFCCKGGNKVNSNTENVSKNKEPIKIKFSHLIIGLILAIFMIVFVVTLSRNSGKSNIDNINGIDNEQANQQINNEEADIKLYDVNNDKPSIIKLDNTTQTGAVYDFTIDDFKLALENVCKQNNIKYEENSNNNENYYGLIINLNSNTTIEISLILENNKIIGLGLVSSILDENSKNNLENKIISEIIEELFEENYANQIIKVENEILCDKYRYANSSLFIKTDLTSIALLQMKDEDEDEIDKHMQEWELITQQLGMNLSIFIIIPTSEEYYKTFKEDLYKIKDKLNFMEDKEETIFKDSNSISYIKFTSNTEFEMMIGVEGSEAFSKSGTYRKNENTVIFNVTYDSELEPSDYNGITEPFSPYEMKINIKDENTLQYIDKYNTTYTFIKGIIEDKEDHSIKSEEKTNTNTISNPSSSDKLQTNKPKKEWSYTHIALTGCVITSSNSKTGEVEYRKKCESCGTVQPGINSTYMKHGILDSSFYCAKCKKIQKIQIEATSEYK